jgi:hypothetical protein
MRVSRVFAALSAIGTGLLLFAAEVPAQTAPPTQLATRNQVRTNAPTDPLSRPARLLVNDVPLRDALVELQRKSGVPMVFSPSVLGTGSDVTCDCLDRTVAQALDVLLRGRALAYELVDQNVVIAAAERRPAAPPPAEDATISGVVSGEFGEPIERANIFISEVGASVIAGEKGEYTLLVPGARALRQQVLLRVRALGYAPQAKPITLTPGSQQVNFTLKQDVNRLTEVVVTGVTAGTEQRNLPFTVARVDEKDMPVPGADRSPSSRRKCPA